MTVSVALHVEGETTVVETNDLRLFHPEHTIVEGKVLEGWYYDDEYSLPYSAVAIKEDTELFAKYGEAAEDYYVYLETDGEYGFAYYWNGEANVNNGWP